MQERNDSLVHEAKLRELAEDHRLEQAKKLLAEYGWTENEDGTWAHPITNIARKLESMDIADDFSPRLDMCCILDNDHDQMVLSYRGVTMATGTYEHIMSVLDRIEEEMFGSTNCE